MSIWYANSPIGQIGTVSAEIIKHLTDIHLSMMYGTSYRRNWSQGLVPEQLYNQPPGDWPYDPPALNSLYRPTGASSWAVGYYLIADSDIADIRNLSQPQILRIDDATGNTTQVQMYTLPTRPLSQIGDTEDPVEGFGLLTLVDIRWFWKEVLVTVVWTPQLTWLQLIHLAAAALGVSVTVDTISSNYLQPSSSLCGTMRAAPLLDTCAYNCGLRVVVGFDGSVRLMNATNSAAVLETLYNQYNDLRVAGGVFNDLDNRVPNEAVVSFQKSNNPLRYYLY